ALALEGRGTHLESPGSAAGAPRGEGLGPSDDEGEMTMVSRALGARGLRSGSSRAVIERLLDGAQIRIGGPNAWDVRVNDGRFFDRVLAHGTIGLGESYMEGWWDCEAIDEFTDRALRFGVKNHPKSWQTRLAFARLRLLDLPPFRRSHKI